MTTGTFMGIAHALAGLTYTLGVLFQALPLPRREIRMWGPTLMMDAVIAEVAIGTVSLAQFPIAWVTTIVREAIGVPVRSPGEAIAIILAQLAAIDATLVLLIAAVSATVILAPVAAALSSMFSQALTWVTAAIVLWIIIQVVTLQLPNLWLPTYALGVAFFAIPFRLGRSIGATLIASSIVLFAALPLAPSIALWLEATLGYSGSVGLVESILRDVQRRPLAILQLAASLPLAVANVLATVVVALVVFPVAYIFLLSLIVRSVASVIGGAAVGPALSSFTLAPASSLGRKLAEAA